MSKKKAPPKLSLSEVKTRVAEVVDMRVDALKDHPLNWRTHDDAQRGALIGSLRELGYAGVTYARRVVSPDERFVREGKLQVGDVCVLDGHCRRKVLPAEFVMKVVILDLNEDEGIKFLAVFDPLGAMAGQDDATLAELLSYVHTDSVHLQEMLGDLYKLPGDDDKGSSDGDSNDGSGDVKYQVLVTCPDELTQGELLAELTARGVVCKSLIG